MNDFRDYIRHYGVKGMHWGVRRYQNPDGTLTDAGRLKYKVKKRQSQNVEIKREHSDYNMDSWGKSRDTNILWITGLSGSGKSTLSSEMAKKNNADLIHIDLYTFKTADKYTNNMSKGFNNFLDKKVPNWKTMQKEAYEVLTKNDRRQMKKAGQWFDTFQDALESYGKNQYGKKKVVAEGVQILDETLFYNNKSALRNQPLVIMNTDMVDSLLSRISRDNKSLDKALEPERMRQMQTFLNGMNDLSDIMRKG